jgi:putative flippase GtrA
MKRDDRRRIPGPASPLPLVSASVAVQSSIRRETPAMVALRAKYDAFARRRSTFERSKPRPVPHPSISRFDVILRAISQKQLLRFLLVGVLNTCFSYSIYVALVYVGLDYVLANLISIVIGVMFSFKTQATLVFGVAGNRRILRFVLVWVCIYFLNLLAISWFIHRGFNSYVSGALVIPFIVVLSYLSQKYFVFRRPDIRPSL